jgi:hypothetical protein
LFAAQFFPVKFSTCFTDKSLRRRHFCCLTGAGTGRIRVNSLLFSLIAGNFEFDVRDHGEPFFILRAYRQPRDLDTIHDGRDGAQRRYPGVWR